MGCAQLGARVGGTEAVEVVHAALDAGVTLFDTADVYGDGESERLLGKALKGQHDRSVIATKFRYAGPNPGASRKSIRVALEASLRRLAVDYVDLYQLHAPDPATPVEATIEALQDLVAHEKILSFGLCNVDPWQVADAQRVAWTTGRAPVTTVQAPINLVQYANLQRLQPLAARFGVGVLAATPLGRGLLGGQYSDSHPPPPEHPLLSSKGVELWTQAGIRTAGYVSELAREEGLTAAQVALAALLARGEVAAVLVGISTRAELTELTAVTPDMVPKETVRRLLKLAAASGPGHQGTPATPSPLPGG
jgi:1-deoxyxylulose-5-phosphate synthase